MTASVPYRRFTPTAHPTVKKSPSASSPSSFSKRLLKKKWDTVLNYIHAVGLPSTLADLGVTEFVEADFRRAAKIAASPKEFTKNVRADITADEVYDAILAADKAGAAQISSCSGEADST